MKETRLRAEPLGAAIRRVARELLALSAAAEQPALVEGDTVEPIPTADQERLIARALEIRRVRAARHRFLRPELLGEPAWDILLDLYISRAQGRRVTVSCACLASMVPPTTGLRHLHTLVEGGEVMRRADPDDGRRVFLELSPAGLQAIEQALATG